MLELFARLKLRLHPMRLLSTAGPLLGRIFWVLIFRQDLRIGTARPIGANCVVRVLKPAQSSSSLAFSSAMLRASVEVTCSCKLHSSSMDIAAKPLPFMKAPSRCPTLPRNVNNIHDWKFSRRRIRNNEKMSLAGRRKKFGLHLSKSRGGEVPAEGFNAPTGLGAVGSRNAPFFRASRNADTRKSLSLRPFVLGFEVAEVLQIVGSVS
jgi:hypothetical protein